MRLLTVEKRNDAVQQVNVYAFKQSAEENEFIYQTRNLNLWYGKEQALENINMSIHDKEVTAIIGSSGCGKSTYLKALNRMVELIPRVRMEGEIAYIAKNILDHRYRSEELRSYVGTEF